jgi:hypothetical protein
VAAAGIAAQAALASTQPAAVSSWAIEARRAQGHSSPAGTEDLGDGAAGEAADEQGDDQCARRGEHGEPGGGQRAAPGSDLGDGMGEVEVAAGEHHRGADAGEDEQGLLGGGRDGQAIGGEQGEDEARGLHQAGGKGDDKASAAGGHVDLRAAAACGWRSPAPRTRGKRREGPLPGRSGAGST